MPDDLANSAQESSHTVARNDVPRQTRPVFIGGCPRSGTTLLGSILGSHSNCLATPESKFNISVCRRGLAAAAESDMGAVVSMIANHWSFRLWDLDIPKEIRESPRAQYSDVMVRLVREYGHKVGKPDAAVWIDHTPANTLIAPHLFELFPQARMVHLVRDGRATAASVMRLDWGPNTVSKAARVWISRVAHGLACESRFGPQRVRQVRYEDLVSEPEATVRNVCEFIGIDFQPSMVSGTDFDVMPYTSNQHALIGQVPDVSRITGWQNELRPRQIEIFENIAGTLLVALNYELVYGMQAKGMTTTESIVEALQDTYQRVVVNRVLRRRRINRSMSS